MAIIKVTNSKATLSKAINYVTKDEKTEARLISGQDCNPSTVLEEMQATKEQFNKLEGRQYYHYVQSFSPKENITHDKAHQIALEWAENNFKGYEVLVATHKDKEHIHSHIIVNSVSFENGTKFHSTKKDLENLKIQSNLICEREGLSTTRLEKDSLTSFNQKKYKSLEKGASGTEKSYLIETWKTVNSALSNSTSREEFIKSMEKNSYKVNWSDARKYITFTTPEGKKVRNSNLAKTFKSENLTKEGMENEIKRNREQGRNESDKPRGTETPGASNVDWSAIGNNIKTEGNRISKQPGNDVIGEIQLKVRKVKDRTDRATGQSKQENRQSQAIQRDINGEYAEPIRNSKQKNRERDRGIER